MARFPEVEAQVQALAQSIVSGLTANPADYPAPPVIATDLNALLTSYLTLCEDTVAARAAAEQATETKKAALEELITAMKAILRYAEDAVGGDDAKLTALGWGARAASTTLELPGQPRTLEAPSQGEGWVFLDWKKPTDGGAVAAYRIERRERPTGDWSLIAMEIETEGTLNNQERGKDWEYRVIARNKTGDSIASNTVAAVV